MDFSPQMDSPQTDPPRVAAPLIFVGGTGRSGTHVVGRLLGRSADLALIPLECRFHVDDRGFPGLLSGEVSKRRFVRRMRGFWWRGFHRGRFRGLHRFIERKRLDAALAAFDERFDSDPVGACHDLFLDLLWFRAERKGALGIVEQSTDVIAQGAVLARVFPEARFVHVVRDGRDASASRVAQTRGIFYPRTRRQGVDWWEARMRGIAAGIAGIPRERLLEVSIDELVATQGPKALHPLARFAGVATGYRVRRYYKSRMSSERANQGRWRRDISDRVAAEIDRRYLESLDRLEAERATAVPLLRQSLARSQATDPTTVPPVPYVEPGSGHSPTQTAVVPTPVSLRAEGREAGGPTPAPTSER
jgi:Sulfotransferase family